MMAPLTWYCPRKPGGWTCSSSMSWACFNEAGAASPRKQPLDMSLSCRGLADVLRALASRACPTHANECGPPGGTPGCPYHRDTRNSSPLRAAIHQPPTICTYSYLSSKPTLIIMRQCRIIKTCANLHYQNLRARHPQAHVGSVASENGGRDRCRSRWSAFAPGNRRYSQVALDGIGTGKARWSSDDLLPPRRTGGHLHADSLCEGRP